MKKQIGILIMAIALVMCGCSNVGSEMELDMLDIVFKECTVYNLYVHNYDMPGQIVTFLDKNGNYYFSYDSELCSLTNEELTERLKANDERLKKLLQSCDADELQEIYKKLLRAAENEKCALDYPEAMPDVEADSTTWYGMYCDKEGKICQFPIHANERMTEIKTNDDRANEVYEWYSGAAKTQEDK